VSRAPRGLAQELLSGGGLTEQRTDRIPPESDCCSKINMPLSTPFLAGLGPRTQAVSELSRCSNLSDSDRGGLDLWPSYYPQGILEQLAQALSWTDHTRGRIMEPQPLCCAGKEMSFCRTGAPPRPRLRGCKRLGTSPA
jgi:hypothetical protein